MINNISSLLLAIAGVSASFVAILGGCIAAKLISINQERENCRNKLSEIRFKRFLFTEQRNMYKQSMAEADALHYINQHSDAFIDDCELEDVYDTNEPQFIAYEELLPYWNKARKLKEKFDEQLQKGNCDFNGLMIPIELVEEVDDDGFEYLFLGMYARWGFSEYFEETEYPIYGEWYDNAKKESLNANNQAMILDVEEQRCEMDLNGLKKPKGMKTGLTIFALFSTLNIIVPLVFSVISLSDKWCVIVACCSIGLLGLGLLSTFLYLAQMLKWKEKYD